MFSSKNLEFLEKIEKTQILVIVEGKKDAEAIKLLGFNKIVKISGRGLEKILEEIILLKPSEVVILTDFDEEGEKIASHLTNLISTHKIKINHLIRNKFKSLKIHKIEELNSLTKLMGDDQNGKIGSIYYKIFNRSRIQGRRSGRETRCYRSYIWPNRRPVRPRFGFEGTSENG